MLGAQRQDRDGPSVLKGGEDSIGYNEAIQRVYFNIGSCAEQCWINHLTDLRAADPEQRNYGQTPFDIGQCRRDCGSFRAIEDRLDDIRAFFLTARPTDLWHARGLASPRDLEVELDAEFFDGAVEQGRGVFAANCARCHSSQPGPYGTPTSSRPTRPTRRYGSTGSATTRSRRPPRSAPIRRGRCIPTTCRAGSGPSTPRPSSRAARPTPCGPRCCTAAAAATTATSRS